MTLIPRAEHETTVWAGNYPLLRDDAFFARTVRVGQKYVDQKARGRLKSPAGFREEMDALREIATADGSVLLAEMEHRWTHPDAPPTLYILAMEVFVPSDIVLIAGDRKLGQRAQSVKVGKAARSLAPRLWVYAGPRGLRRAEIEVGSLVLRAVVYGAGSTMLHERDVQRHAKTAGAHLTVMASDGIRHGVTSESYWGADLAEGIFDFLRGRVGQS